MLDLFLHVVAIGGRLDQVFSNLDKFFWSLGLMMECSLSFWNTFVNILSRVLVTVDVYCMHRAADA